MLEGLGWRIHRVWSTDWFRKPQAELERVLAAVEDAKHGRLGPTFSECLISRAPECESRTPQAPPSAPPPEETAPPEDAGAPILIGAVPYATYASPRRRKSPEAFYAEPLGVLEKLLTDIVACEGPIHVDEAFRRAAAQYDLRQVRSAIRDRAGAALQRAVSKGAVIERGEFLWPAGMAEPPVRVRGESDLSGRLGASVRDAELICPEEIARAATMLLHAQFGMGREDLVTQVARAFGFRTTGQKLRERIDAVIAQALADGLIVESGSGILKAAGDTR